MAWRVIFFGTAELACASLRLLAEDPRFEIPAVVTQPDKPKGRDLKLHPSPVKALALQKNLPVLQPLKARDPAFIDQLRQLAPDLIVVAAYGQILPQALLDLPPHGCLNVHTSLLPKYRGAAPIQSALLQGDPETGVTIMKMDAGLDTGPILSTITTPIQSEDNAQTLHDRLAHLGADILLRTIPEYLAGKLKPIPQPEGASYAAKITKQDGQIDWSLSAAQISNRLRAFTPWPGSFTHFPHAGKPRLLKIWRARPVACPLNSPPGTVLDATPEGILVACGMDALLITELQREGSRKMPAREFLQGTPLRPGDIFATPSSSPA